MSNYGQTYMTRQKGKKTCNSEISRSWVYDDWSQHEAVMSGTFKWTLSLRPHWQAPGRSWSCRHCMSLSIKHFLNLDDICAHSRYVGNVCSHKPEAGNQGAQ